MSPAETPLSYLRTFGPAADPATALIWGALALSVLVVLIITILVLVGAVARRGPATPGAITSAPVERGGRGMTWVWIGTGVSCVALAGVLGWTFFTLGAVGEPATAHPLVIEVTARQWWWRVAYPNDDASQTIVTANEIHIPVGRPVRIKLIGADVIHSFWVPALAGKTDAIPGQTNSMWLQADRPGVYRGQCAEYCGLQHAKMAFEIVAEPPAGFEAWRRAQLLDAPVPVSPSALQGQQVFVARCGACHAVRGSGADDGRAGPDLTHLMSRATLAAGALPNTPGGLSGWIANPQAIKPGTTMPTPYLSGPELAAVRGYLVTLR